MPLALAAAGVAPLLVPIAQGASDGLPQQDAELFRFQGTWHLRTLKTYDPNTQNQTEIQAQGKMIIEGHTVQFKVDVNGGQSFDYKYKLELHDGRPFKRFHAVWQDDAQTTIRGIYLLNGDTLIRCHGLKNDLGYPKDLEHGVYSIWKRAPK
ncbi:MAG: hypothetical protein JSS27_19685 [Planctomycetes bacterium]|nr:hypothetical protein [Planctomycetota bacterium]